MGLLVTESESAITGGEARIRYHRADAGAPENVVCVRVPKVCYWWQSVGSTTGTERRQMSAKTGSRLTPRERLTRGLTYSAVGPVDVTRGVVGLGVQSAQSTASELRRRYLEGRLAREITAAQESLAQELAAAQEVVANLPQALQDARRSQRRSKRPWVMAGAAVVVLAGGAVAFSVVRRSVRSQREEPSPRPPSVDVQPRP